MRIAVIYNEPVRSTASDHWLASDLGTLPPDFEDASEVGVLDEVERVEQYLHNAGHDTIRFAVDDVYRLVAFLEEQKPDLVFNACESFRGNDELTSAISGVFDLLGVEYTGSPTLALGIGLDKSISKSLFLSQGVRTPPFIVLQPGDPLPRRRLKYPQIVKPVRQDASNGITANSVVHNSKQLAQRAQFVWEMFEQAALVEEFIDGRELNVALLAVSANQWAILPIAEILFRNFGDRPRIVGYEGKWVPGSIEYEGTVPQCPADLPEPIAAEVRDLAARAARIVGLRDYGRVDMRVRDGVPYVLEANPNPDISHDAGFARSAAASGRTHEQAILEMVARAMERKHARAAAAAV